MQQLIRNLLDKQGGMVYKIIFVLYTIFLFTVTLMPLDILDSGQDKWFTFFEFQDKDKFVHTVLFCIFAGLIYLALNLPKISMLIISLLTGVLIEILQYVMGCGRTFDLLDVLADAIGTLIMLSLIYFYERKPAA